MEKAQALIKERAAPGVTLKRITLPELGPDQVRVRMKAASVDGSDAHIYRWDGGQHPLAANVPYIIGHEGAGIVEAAGEKVDRLKPGDHVAFESTIAGDDCRRCAGGFINLCEDLRILGIGNDGILAERVVVPARIAIKVPPEIPFEAAALFEPFGVSIRAVNKAKRVFEALYPEKGLTEARVLILGGTGSIGMIALKGALALGAKQVAATGRNPEALTMIKRDHPAVKLLSKGETDLRRFAERNGRFDIVIEATGATEVIRSALAVIAKGGVWVQVGLIREPEFFFDLNNTLVRRELHLAGSWGRALEDWDLLFRLIKESKIDLAAMINRRFHFPRQWEKMFAAKGKNILLFDE